MADKKRNNPKSDANERRSRKDRRETTSLILMAVGGVVLAIVLTIAAMTVGGSAQPARIGQPIGNLTLASLGGGDVNLGDYRGKLVLINAWATWCPPCKAEMPALQAYYNQHKADGFELLAVNAGETETLVQQYITEQGFTFPILLDPNSSNLNALGINNFPTSILVGRDGVVKTIHVGLFTPEELEAEITPFLND